MKKFKAHILIVDDDDRIRELVKQYLNDNDYLVTTANSAEDAKEKVNILKFDIIVLDIMMPGKSGLEFTNENKKKINTPIILLTAKGEASDRIEGLETGADDYLAKPFEPRELVLRIKNILRKTKNKIQKRVVNFSNINIDLNKLLIIKNNKEFKINNTEKKILEKMINSPGEIFTREDIGKLINLNKERSVQSLWENGFITQYNRSLKALLYAQRLLLIDSTHYAEAMRLMAINEANAGFRTNDIRNSLQAEVQQLFHEASGEQIKQLAQRLKMPLPLELQPRSAQ